MLPGVLSELADVIAPFLDADSVVLLGRTSKQLHSLRAELLKRVVRARVGPCENWRAVGARFFGPSSVPRFSMRNSLSMVVMCDFRAFLWCEVKQCVEQGCVLSPLRMYLENGLRRARGDALECFGTEAGRDHLVREAAKRPAQYPSRDARRVVDAIALDLEHHARSSFVVNSDGSVGVAFATSPAVQALLCEIGDRVPRWCGILVAAIQASVPAHLQGFYGDSLELEE